MAHPPAVSHNAEILRFFLYRTDRYRICGITAAVYIAGPPGCGRYYPEPDRYDDRLYPLCHYGQNLTISILYDNL